MNNVLIFGKGYIGQKLQEYLNCNLTSKRINKYEDLQTEINKYKPKIIINCIGYTGINNVDDCEKDIGETLVANTFVPLLMAEASIRNNIKLIHISSGCIYHYNYKKQKPIKEIIPSDYYSLYYSRTKIYSENVLKELSKYHNVLITRIRIPLDNEPNPKNILDKLLKYKKIIDIPNSITYIPDFLDAIKHLIKIKAKGIFNITLKGGLRYPDLLDEYIKYHSEFKYAKTSLKSLKINRTNLILSTKKLEDTGFKVRTVKSVIKECIKQYINNEKRHF